MSPIHICGMDSAAVSQSLIIQDGFHLLQCIFKVFRFSQLSNGGELLAGERELVSKTAVFLDHNHLCVFRNFHTGQFGNLCSRSGYDVAVEDMINRRVWP